jgi:hypothetical protein
MLHWLTFCMTLVFYGLVTYRESENVLQDIWLDIRILMHDPVAAIVFCIAILIIWGGFHNLVELILRMVN